MNPPKLHHYVPQFYLRRFVDDQGKFWVWDKVKDRIFATSPGRIAAETNFYFLDELDEQGHDPLTMEKQFSMMENEASIITDQWISWLNEIELGKQIEIPSVNRDIVARYIALQFLRTADTRDILSALSATSEPFPEKERRRLHTYMLWNQETVDLILNRARDSTWTFGRNSTSTPFLTSDNPVTFRTSDNAMWLKAGILSDGSYIVFPLSPRIVMYCYPKEPPWEKLAKFTLACLPFCSPQGWFVARTLVKSSWHRASSFRR